jgi:hypothetical protein
VWAGPESSTLPTLDLGDDPPGSVRGAPTFGSEPGDEASGEVREKASTAKILGLTWETGRGSFRESPGFSGGRG